MGATTPNLDLYKPGGGSTGTIVPDERVDIDKINGNSDLIDAFAGTQIAFRAAQLTRNQQYRGLAADIGTVAGMVLGDTYQETDGNKKVWTYDGAAWISRENGLFIVRPTAVAVGGGTATVDDRGNVVITNATGYVNIDGCVPAGARKISVTIINDSTQTDDHQVYLRLRAAGADIGGSTYYTMTTEERIGSGPNRQESSNAVDWVVGITRLRGGYHEISIANVQSANRKFMHYHSIDSSVYEYTGAGTIGANTAAATGIRVGLHATSGDTGIIKITAVI